MTIAKTLRLVLRQLPQRGRASTHALISHLVVGNALLRWYHGHSIDAFILSFPKCGRTWLRVMLAKAFELHYSIVDQASLGSNYLTTPRPGIPVIKVTHDDKPQVKTADELVTEKTKYKGTRVVLLVRDPRDAMVSNYFQHTKRRKRYAGDLSSFLQHDRGSVDTFIRFYNIWAENRHVPVDFLLVRYEDMHANPEAELRRVLDFLRLEAVSADVVKQAVAYASFESMRNREKTASGDAPRKLRPADDSDPDSYKTRRGKVGGYTDYLSEAEVAALNEKISTQLSSLYGYR